MNPDIIPYSKIKDSNVKWLGDVPEHWDVLPNRAIFREIKERDRPDEQMLSVTITRGIIKQQTLLADNSKKDSSNLDRSNYKLVRPGDIVYNKMRAWQGAIGMSEYQGIVSPAYVVQRPLKNVDPRFLHYLLRTPAFAKEAEQWSYGITSDMWSLRPEHFKMIYVCVPSIPEQASIVRFLNHVERQIRQFIRAKQKLINLLDEQKQVIINQAVTRGLNLNVRLKHSGVEWLGDVPEHWELCQIRSIANIVRGSSPRPAGSPLYFHGEGPPWITVGEITKDSSMYLTSTNSRLTPAGAKYSRLVESETLLLTNSGATLGVPKISLIQGCINDGVAAFQRLQPRVSKEFLFFYWTTQTVHLKAWVDLGAQPNLNTQIIGSWPIAIPQTIHEQEEIVEYIKRNTELLTRTIEQTRKEVTLVSEFRTRLIADVVMGKLDVRHVAARLPDEEPELLHDMTAEFSPDAESSDTVDETLEPIEA